VQTERTLRAVAGDAWVESHLRPLVGLPSEQELGGDTGGEAFAAWRRFLEEIADERPLVLVLEDLHWADESLLDFVDYLVDWSGGVPVLCVCTARPELLENRSGWGGGKSNALTLSLSPLTDDDTAQLVGELFERRLLPAEMQAGLLVRAGGNPLYAEQFARMLEERGQSEELPLPETVQGIIAARLDGLAPEQKSLLQDAAVLGKTFPLGGLVRVTGAEASNLEKRLHALERREFVRRERQPTDRELEYSFRHILVRDVAYGQIPRAERGEKHRRAAEWIESLGRSDDHAEMLAYHYLEALELAEAAGLPSDTIAESARTALRDAADRARALNAYSAAARFYAVALRIWPVEDELGRARLLFGRAVATLQVEPEALDVAIEARDALLSAGDIERAVEVETELAAQLWYQGRRDASNEHADRALALATEAPGTAARAYALTTRARNLAVAGETDEAIKVGRKRWYSPRNSSSIACTPMR
jgi:predicted ATPase